jgi:rare lipoprotein A (peptidoglycan hydrolase)
MTVTMACVLLANCASDVSTRKMANRKDPKYGVSASPRIIVDKGPIESRVQHRGVAMVGKPYTVAGKRYVPKDDPGLEQEGTASWYGDDFHGRLTANGEIYDMHDLSAAHPTMPLPSYARVTNARNGYSVVVRVNDRGPYHDGRVIDVSRRAAELLDMKDDGISDVKVEYLGRASTRGSDEEMLMATLRTDGSAAPTPGYPSGVMVAEAKPIRTPLPVVRASFAPVDDFAVPATGSDTSIAPDYSLDLGTISNADRPVPRPQVPERSASLSGPGKLGVEDIVSSSKPRVMAFASLTEPQPAARLYFAAGVFADRDNAERLVARLAAGGDVRISPFQRDGRTLWSVRAGPFASQDEATLARDLAIQAGSVGARITD